MPTLATRPGPHAAPSRPAPSPDRAQRVFLQLLDRHLEGGAVRVRFGGRAVTVGRPEGGVVGIRVNDRNFFRRVLTQGNLGMGESFMDGHWEVDEGDLHALLTLLLKSRIDHKVRGDPATAWEVLKVQAANALRRRQWAHARRHYDLGDDLFEAFLDPTLTYSCGYALSPGDSLEALQAQKLDRICRKLELRPGHRLLDVGCGFGGLLIHAARHFGAEGVGITTSRRHAEAGAARVRAAGLEGRVRIECRDHRTIHEGYDRVVSVGMMEHLPRREYGRYFARIAAALPAHGVGLVHAIGCNAARNVHDPFIQKHIFPGSGQPRLSEIATGCEAHGLALRDVENLVRHYALTARAWLDRFRAARHRLDPARYDARFQRMWEYYLACGVAGALASDAALYQVLFMRDPAGPMPLHRV